MYIALATYAIVVIGIIAALFFGKWSDELDLCFKWVVGALAIAGLLAFAIDFGIQTPRGLWIALKERTDRKVATVNAFMTEGHAIRRTLGTAGDYLDTVQCEEWEQNVYDWLAENQPDFKEQFRLDFVPGGQQWSPNLLDKPVSADWLNTLDRRLYRLGELLNYLRRQQQSNG